MMKASKILVNSSFPLRTGTCAFWLRFNLSLLLLLQLASSPVFHRQVKILTLIFLLHCVNAHCRTSLLEYATTKCDKSLRILRITVLLLLNYPVRFERSPETVDLYFGQLCSHCCHLTCYKDTLWHLVAVWQVRFYPWTPRARYWTRTCTARNKRAEWTELTPRYSEYRKQHAFLWLEICVVQNWYKSLTESTFRTPMLPCPNE